MVQSLALFVGLFCCTQSNSWNGIVPLKSTQTDVERVLGKPDPKGKNKFARSYNTRNEKVFVLYSTGTCGPKSHGWNVPAKTVIRLTVTPAEPPKLADYKFDLTRFKSYIDDKVDLETFGNEVDGFGFTIDGEKQIIYHFLYHPRTEDRRLICNSAK